MKPLRASSDLNECPGVLFRAEQVLVGVVGWCSIVEWTNRYFEPARQARAFGPIPYFLHVMQKSYLIWSLLPFSFKPKEQNTQKLL